MKEKKIIVLMGESGSGKDSVAKYLEDKMGIRPIVSYTTRPKRECEEEGREHHFIQQNEMDRLKKEDILLAWVKLGVDGYEYCTALSDLTDEVMTYILDPEGLKNLRGNREVMEKVDLFVLYIYVPYEERRRRVALRNSLEEFDRRTENESPMFELARATHMYDVMVFNKDLDDTCRSVEKKVKDFIFS